MSDRSYGTARVRSSAPNRNFESTASTADSRYHLEDLRSGLVKGWFSSPARFFLFREITAEVEAEVRDALDRRGTWRRAVA